MQLQQQAAEGATIVGKTSSIATYGGASGAIASGLASDTVFGLTTSQWSVVGVIGGLVIALMGFAANVHFKRQHLLIAQGRGAKNE